MEVERLVDSLGREPQDAPEAEAPSAPATAPTDSDLLPEPPALSCPVAFLDPRVALSARLAPSLGVAAEPARPDGRLVHRPALVAEVSVTFDEAKAGFVLQETLVRGLFPLAAGGPGEPVAIPFAEGDLCAVPPEGSLFAPLPAWADDPWELAALGQRVVERILRSETRGLWSNPRLSLYATAGEPRPAFEARCRAAVEARIDAEAARLKVRWAGKADKLHERIAAKQARLADQQGVLRARRAEEALNAGQTLLSLFGGRRRSLSTAVTRRRQVQASHERVSGLEEEILALQHDLLALEEDAALALAEARTRQEAALGATVEEPVGLEKDDVRLTSLGVVWVPVNRRL
jgi:hypothetical protein